MRTTDHTRAGTTGAGRPRGDVFHRPTRLRTVEAA